MSSRATSLTISGNQHRASPSQGHGFIAMSVLAVAVVSCSLAIAGKLDSSYGITIPVLAGLAGLIGWLMPRLFLTLIFASGPLVWALGDANVLQGDRAHVNLPMFVGFIVVVGFSHHLLMKDSDPGVEQIRKLVVGMALVCFPAIFFAQDFVTGAGGYLRVMCPYVVMFAVLRLVRDKADVLHYARSMAFALLAVALVLSIAYWRSELWVDFGGYTRLGALYFQTQGFGVLLSVLVLVVMLNYLLTRKQGYLWLLIFPLVTVFLTYFRTAWIGSLVLVVLFTFQIKKTYRRMLLLIGSILVMIFFPMLRQSFLRYDTALDSPEVADKVFSGRLALDAIAIETYLDSPLVNKVFGIGYFRAGEATSLVYGQEFLIHDDYLGLLIEVGIVSLLVHLAILFSVLKRSRMEIRHPRDRTSRDLCRATSALIIAVMIMGIPGAFYTQVLSNFYVYGIIGLMLGLSHMPGTLSSPIDC
jgi:O-antigen ligase/polysaccharide polymerase Wzy-like membrane protein